MAQLVHGVRKTKTLTMKIQRQLGPEPDGDVLVYNEDRSVTGFFPLSSELRALMGRRRKIYVVGELQRGILDIHEVVGDQPW